MALNGEATSRRIGSRLYASDDQPLARVMRYEHLQALNDWRCLVYRLLLPLEANAQRHLLNEKGPSNLYWSRLWALLQRVFGRAGLGR